MSNIIAFALLYWELDGGGAAERAHRPSSRIVDLAFPQQMNPSLAPAHWRPRFIDYLYLGFTNATAFSPTDAMPLAPWAKITMALQALISLVILGLVIARAVKSSPRQSRLGAASACLAELTRVGPAARHARRTAARPERQCFLS